LCSHP
ncbi:hypothetical protein CP8484711_0685, partial [Chlamydia psittaci 84-8471/1]